MAASPDNMTERWVSRGVSEGEEEEVLGMNIALSIGAAEARSSDGRNQLTTLNFTRFPTSNCIFSEACC